MMKEDKKLLDQLANVTVNRLESASFKAVVRLHLYFTGRTHELMKGFADKAQGAILRAGGNDQVLNATNGWQAQSDMLRIWGDTWTEWVAEFQQARREAARIAFGVFAIRHDRMVVPSLLSSLALESIRQTGRMALVENKVTDGMFDPQLRILMDAAENYLYGDGLNLSGRIWQIDREARAGITNILLDGIANQKSAWDVAKSLEIFLGANADCPRWTSTRLYGRTKSEIAAGNTTGLIRGDDCKGQGVSYNALRLARTEIQKMHSMATDRMLKQQPWVTSEQIHLSAAHPDVDECDDAVKGGERGNGVYPVGTIVLPLHPNCLCNKTAVMMDQDEFTSELNAWVKGGQSAIMDQYARSLGVDVSTSLMPAAINLAVWMFSNELQEWLK